MISSGGNNNEVKKTIRQYNNNIGNFLSGRTSNSEGDFEVVFNDKIEHIRGMGYAGETDGLYFVTHGGLK